MYLFLIQLLIHQFQSNPYLSIYAKENDYEKCPNDIGEFCIEIYDPVCGILKDQDTKYEHEYQIKKQTFSNSCYACQNSYAFKKGECEILEKNKNNKGLIFLQKDIINDSQINYCPKEVRQFCTKEYRPVCGYRDNQNKKTYGNSCMACIEAQYWIQGQCEDDQNKKLWIDCSQIREQQKCQACKKKDQNGICKDQIVCGQYFVQQKPQYQQFRNKCEACKEQFIQSYYEGSC